MLKDEIEALIGKGSCWIDLTGIESDKQFIDVIIDSIDNADIFLFMYSKYSDMSEWTRKEVEYAKNEHKRIVFVKIDQAPMSKYYRFQFSGHDIIDIFDKDQKRKLLNNLVCWVNGNDTAQQEPTFMQDIDKKALSESGKEQVLSSVKRLLSLITSFVKCFTQKKTWVILINLAHIQWAFLIFIGVSVSECDEDMFLFLTFSAMISLMPCIISILRPNWLGVKSKWKSCLFLSLPVILYILGDIVLYSQQLAE